MKPNETVQFCCGMCGIVFKICVAPHTEWVEPMSEAEIERLGIGEPTICPFCKLGKLRPANGQRRKDMTPRYSVSKPVCRS